MSEADRVHEPSPIRLLRAREEGTVTRSGELVRSLVVCVLIGAILMFASTAQQLFEKNLTATFSSVAIKTNAIDTNQLNNRVAETLMPFLFLFVGIVGLAIVFWHVQFPIKLMPQKVAPDFTRNSPIAAFQRILSVNNFANATIGLVGLAVFVTIGFAIVFFQPEIVVGVFGDDFRGSVALAGKFIKNFLLAAGATLIVFGILDYIRERIRISSQLQMTDEERREEARESEPNPQWRQRLNNNG